MEGAARQAAGLRRGGAHRVRQLTRMPCLWTISVRSGSSCPPCSEVHECLPGSAAKIILAPRGVATTGVGSKEGTRLCLADVHVLYQGDKCIWFKCGGYPLRVSDMCRPKHTSVALLVNLRHC